MRKKSEFLGYTVMWMVAVLVLIALLLQNVGDARIVNYSGIVRGATQKLVKEELSGLQDDPLIRKLDGIIYDLRTGKGEYDLRRNGDEEFQRGLTQLDAVWGRIKAEIYSYRSGSTSEEELFRLSQKHFELADQMVLCAEKNSDTKLIRSILCYFVILILSVGIFVLWQKRGRKELEKSLYTDGLTGILNRTGFEERAAAILSQYDARQYCLIEIDIDDFKFINNIYGYEYGDKMLCVLASALQDVCGSDQVCARIDADDFVVLAKRGIVKISNLRSTLAQQIKDNLLIDISDFITFTVGGYEIKAAGEMIQSMMDKANMAHKSAKKLGKASTMWYNDKLLEQLRSENQLKNRMARALDDGEFKMYLQPKYAMAEMTVCGAEALVRWEIPGQGIIFPDDFIPLFETNGYIAELDFYMLKKSCAYIRKRMDEGKPLLPISVNFSRVTIYRRGFYSNVLEIVDGYGIPYSSVELEITESAFNEIPESMVNKLIKLQRKGFLVSMDDFGAGYSSLNLLDKLPIQVLKLDREFLREYEQTEKVKHVIACVVELAHALEMKVVCEGVELQAHADFLRRIGCDCGQGYYFSRPVPQEAFEGKIEEWRVKE